MVYYFTVNHFCFLINFFFGKSLAGFNLGTCLNFEIHLIILRKTPFDIFFLALPFFDEEKILDIFFENINHPNLSKQKQCYWRPFRPPNNTVFTRISKYTTK